jgi:hypothetical protein
MDERKTSERRAGNATREAASRAGDTAREAADRAQESSTRAAEGFRDYQLKILSAAQANINSWFEYVQDVVQAQSISEVVELSTSHSRRQLEAIAQQSRELANAAQRLATDTARPLGGFGNQFNPMG